MKINFLARSVQSSIRLYPKSSLIFRAPIQIFAFRKYSSKNGVENKNLFDLTMDQINSAKISQDLNKSSAISRKGQRKKTNVDYDKINEIYSVDEMLLEDEGEEEPEASHIFVNSNKEDSIEEYIRSKDREQLLLEQLYACQNIIQLSDFVYFTLFSNTGKVSLSKKKKNLLGQPRLQLKVELTSSLLSQTIKSACKMRCIDLAYFIYRKTSNLPLEDRLRALEADFYCELIKGIWNITRDIQMIENLSVELISCGLQANEELVNFLRYISGELSRTESRKNFDSQILSSILASEDIDRSI
ncbi:hypothetical protein AYI68_g8074 [Smittium mucronatum]|uniref:Mtf2-like C-terminal domain-containing protein n=1 Tax=Smittium mucronatum TaxID=133383 RepID=A0A1R0GLY8_9FUNG|nr:hypothetical protein AYI68_g8074 [Smittium mucronatum]